MNGPSRLRDTGSDEVRALLRHASPPRPIDAKAFSRGERHIARLAAIPVGLGLVFWLKGIALGAGLGVVVVAGVVAVETTQTTTRVPAASVEPSPEPSVTKAPAAPVLPSSQAPTEPPPDDSAVLPKASPVVSTKQPQDAGVDSLAQEALLIEQARGFVGSDPARALSLTQEYRRRFPRGQLGLESEIVAMESLVQLGRRAEACARAAVVLQRAPGIYADRIRNLCPPEP